MAKKKTKKSSNDFYWALPKWARIILSLPGLDIVFGIYRIFKGIAHSNILTLVMGILWIFIGTTIFWVADLICSILGKQLLFSK